MIVKVMRLFPQSDRQFLQEAQYGGEPILESSVQLTSLSLVQL